MCLRLAKRLITKARISDGRTEARPSREEKEKQLGIMNVRADLFASGSVRGAVLKEKSYADDMLNPPRNRKGSVDASITDGGHEPIAAGGVMPNPEEIQASADTSWRQDSISEERTREHKAKAFAKLEELNRRKLMENQTQMLECGAFELNQEEHLGGSLIQIHTSIGVEAPGLFGYNAGTAFQAGEDVIKIKESVESSWKSEDSSVGAMDQPVHLTLDDTNAEFVAEKSIS